MTYTIIITEDYVKPEEPFTTNEEYLTFVMNMAAQSYKTQYGTETLEDGITAARNA